MANSVPLLCITEFVGIEIGMGLSTTSRIARHRWCMERVNTGERASYGTSQHPEMKKQMQLTSCRYSNP